jgi:excinuclease ABC subunit C
MILEGRKQNLLKKMEKEMLTFSKQKAFEKAAMVRNRIFALKHIRDVALISQDFETENNLKTKSQKPKTIRIEAYDISNISGQYAVGSMVVFNDGQPEKKEYRKFKIKTVEGIDDVGMMTEVLFRRFQHTEWTKPDLILLDGGLGHLHMAEKVLQELNLKIPLAAVAKGPTRKNVKIQMANDKQATTHNPQPTTHNQQLTTNHEKAGELNLEIERLLKNKNLIKRIMDEAHRFAIGYHRKLRKKSFLMK